MQHIIVNKHAEINLILRRFFEEKYTRSSLPVKLENENLECFDLACRIYKRGFMDSPVEPGNDMAKLGNDIFDIPQRQDDIYFIIDENFLKYHSDIKKRINKSYFIYCPAESTKNLTTVKNIIQEMPENTKSIFAIGGGITLDIAGFIAGLLDIPVDYLSTTLLASVDAAVGGKTGVNFSPYGKNQVGLFYAARSLTFSPEFMQSLSIQEKICGVVEAIKHAFLFGQVEIDTPILEKIITNKATKKDYLDIVQKNYRYKSFVIKLDPFEKKDIRSSLNFGHTLAHVLEALCEQDYIEYIPHGIAVAHGLKFLINYKFLEAPTEFSLFIDKILKKYTLKIKKNISQEIIMHLLSQDKKNSQREKCTLSLPPYKIFSLSNEITLDSEINYSKITKEFSINEISKKMLDYIFEDRNYSFHKFSGF